MEIQVSFGEIIDKWTILQIKSEKIKDEAKNREIIKELSHIQQKCLDSKIIINQELFDLMLDINRDIWNIMDNLRDGNLNDETYTKECKRCIDYNDARFKVKKILNELTNSEIKEQKSYKTRKMFIYMKMSRSRLLKISMFFDEVYVFSKTNSDKLYNINFVNIYDKNIKYDKVIKTEDDIDFI
jgi:hypothetical protein